MQLPKLYNRNAKGKIKEWSVEVITREDDLSKYPFIKIVYGLLGGKLQIDTEIIDKGKNEGKSNVTSPISQAVLEAKARWNHKRDREGYKSLEDLNIETIDDTRYCLSKAIYNNIQEVLDKALPKTNELVGGIILPMKCRQYEGKMKFPVIAQPKLNGFRCTASLEIKKEGMLEFPEVTFRNKTGIQFTTLAHIIREFKLEWFGQDGNLVFDGELYIHGLPLQDISSAARRVNSNTAKLEFHIFDLAIPGTPQDQRIWKLEDIRALVNDDNNLSKFIKIVDYDEVTNDAQAQIYCDQCIADGFEGAIFRDTKAEYQFGRRPMTIQKLKRFSDAEFEILDIKCPNDVAEYCVLVLRNDKNDLTFESAPEGTLEYRANLYYNRELYIGKKATVQFFERTKDELPFHTKVVNIDRNDA